MSIGSASNCRGRDRRKGLPVRRFLQVAVITSLGVSLVAAARPGWAQQAAETTAPQGEPVVAEPAWTKLFDGRTFDGWEGNLEWFRIQDGAIVGGTLDRPIPRNEFLCTRRPYDDFELQLEVKAVGEGVNAGIQFRTRRLPDHHEVSGYQADVGAGWWGKLYDESRRNRVLAGPKGDAPEAVVHHEDWNRYRIRCQGSRIQLWLNDQLTVDYEEADPEIARRGVIGLQIHGGPPSEAWYRSIQIRELSP